MKQYRNALLSGVFWGLGTVLLSISLNKMPEVPHLTWLSTFLHDSFSFLFLFLLFSYRKEIKAFWKLLRSKSGLGVALAALLGGPVGMGAYLFSLSKMNPALAAAISSVYPAVGAFLSYLFLKEDITKRQIIGLSISIVAIMAMTILGAQIDGFSPVGLVAVLVTVLAWGSEAVIVAATLKEDVSSDLALGVRQFTSMIVYAFIIVPSLGYNHLPPILNTKTAMIFLLIAALAATASYLFYYRGIAEIGPSKAMALNITYPAWAFFFQILFFKNFSWQEFFFVILLLFGAFYGMKEEED